MLDSPAALDSEDLAAHHAWLLRLARRLAADEGAAEDLAQGAWAELVARGTHAVRDLRAFLGGVARVLAARERASARARTVREARAAREEALPSTEALAERLELARVLAEELARLAEPERTLLLLHHQEGVALAEIARERGVPEGTVRAQATRARAALRARLDRRYGERREAWAALALAGARTGAALGAATLGGLAMHASLKVGIGVVALACAGWLLSRGNHDAPAAAPRLAAREADAPLAAPELDSAPSASREELAPDERAASAPSPAPEAPPLRVRLVDSADGLPLARYAVRVEPDGAPEGEHATLESDDAGELELDLARFPLPLELVALDDPEDPIDLRQVRRIERAEPDAGALVVDLLSGPTYFLAFAEPPPDGANVSFALRPGRGPDVGFGFDGRLRAGATPWVRIPPESANPANLGEGPWTLTARDFQGYWIAWGEVRQLSGTQAEPVSLAAKTCGALLVEITVGGERIDSVFHSNAARLTDDRPTPGVARQLTLYPPEQRGFPGSGGRGSITHLDPGTYRVAISAPGFETLVRDVDVRAGERTHVEHDFERRDALAALDVVLRSQTGRSSLSGLALDARGPSGELRTARWIERRSDGAVLYRFDGLAPGEWEVVLDETPHLPPWDRTSARGRPGGAPIELTCLDEGAPPNASVVVRVVDAETGDALPLSGVTTFVAQRPQLSQTTDAQGEARTGPHRIGQELELYARAAGHRCARAVVRVTEGADPVRIELERGWGALLRVGGAGPSRWNPLEGAEVRLDGELAGKTDAHGQILLSAASRPARLDVALAGWRVQHGDFTAEGGPSAQELYPLFVAMERER